MEPLKFEKTKPEMELLNLQEIANSAFADILNSVSSCKQCRPDGPPEDLFADLNEIINPSCIVLDGKAISLDQISAPQLKEILQKIVTVVAKPLIMENRKQSTLVSVLTARVQALEMQISKKDNLVPRK